MSKRSHEQMSNGHIKEVTISDYILTRLEQVGVTCLYGVPGDFFLRFLDYVEDHKAIEWVGCTNELNASYAADGYARLKQGLGVLVTTFGVGELSATNGIAGAFSEWVPVLHIVGVPSTGLQSKGAMLHHTLGDGRFDAFQNIYSNITITQAHIKPPHKKTGTSDAGEEIDRAIFEALKNNKPTYLTLPTDLVDSKIPAEPLMTPITHASITKILALPKVSDVVEDVIIKQICKMYERATKPCVLVDAGVTRFRMQKETKDLIQATGMTFFSSPMGKTAIDERHAQFGGIYVGTITIPEVKEAFESSDFILSIGSLKTDFNTASFSYRVATEYTVELHHNQTLIQYATYPDAGYQSLLPKLTAALGKIAATKDKSHFVHRPLHGGLTQNVPATPTQKQAVITQDEFWPLWATFFNPGDVIVSEIGTSSFGLLDVQLPENSTLLTQILWGSIGWATGATLGAAIAAREQGRRTILFTGDGSIQLSVQEISTMIRQGVKPIIVILNNDGYVVERLIHGRGREYNNIKNWNWQKLLEVFDPPAGSYQSFKTNNRQELEDLLVSPELQDTSKLTLVECILGDFDAPRALRAQADLVAHANRALEA